MHHTAFLIQKFEFGGSLSVDDQLNARTALGIGKGDNGGFVSVLSNKDALSDTRGLAKFLQGLRLFRAIGHLLKSLQFFNHLPNGSVGPVPNVQTGRATAVVVAVGDSDCLILIELIEQQAGAGLTMAIFFLPAE